jgi:hypothetical protein
MPDGGLRMSFDILAKSIFCLTWAQFVAFAIAALGQRLFTGNRAGYVFCYMACPSHLP